MNAGVVTLIIGTVALLIGWFTASVCRDRWVPLAFALAITGVVAMATGSIVARDMIDDNAAFQAAIRQSILLTPSSGKECFAQERNRLGEWRCSRWETP